MEVRDICFVRHAKSSWDHPGLKDYDRPLDNRGLRDAPMMGAKMKKLGLIPQLIITSGAKRARTTAEFFAEEFSLAASDFLIQDKLYEASPDEVFEVVRSVPSNITFVYLFGHNPSFTWVANSLSGIHIDNVPTCGVVHAQANLSDWKKFKPEHTGFIGFHYPKQFLK